VAAGGNVMDIYDAYKTWPEDIRKKLSFHDLRRMGGWTPKPTGEWAIDNIAGRTILLYEECSVIEGEQAMYALWLIAADQSRRNQVPDIALTPDTVHHDRPEDVA